MTQVVLARRAVEDLERLVEFLVEAGDPNADSIIELVQDGVGVLRRHPFAGRPAELGLREMVISQGRTGSLALYDYRETDDVVTVLAVRHQRELGWSPTSSK